MNSETPSPTPANASPTIDARRKNALARARREAYGAWRFPPRLLPSEWAEQYRVLSPEATAEFGPWRNDAAPHLVKPLNHLSPYDSASRVVCKFSSQSGKTEILLNFLGYLIDCDPGPTIVVQPSVKPMAEAFSKERLATMLRDCPTLKAKVGESKGNVSDSTITHKSFPGGHASIIGANSPAGLSSRPCRYLLGDELDRWETTKEGDSLLLGRTRLRTYRARRESKELLVSSPTFDDVGIDAEYKSCEQRWQWRLECPECGEWQWPELDHFSRNEDKRCTYHCKACGVIFDEGREAEIKAAGAWVCTAGEHKASPDSVGFWFSQWSSPFQSWSDTLSEWEAAKGEPIKEQVITNVNFAQTWKGAGEKVDPSELIKRCEDWGEKVPEQVRIITAGVDCQADRLEIEVVGWGAGEESWSLDYQVVVGSPTEQQTWDDLQALMGETYQRADGSGMRVETWCIDSGNWAQQVYGFVRKLRSRHVIPVKGSSRFDADAITGGKVDRSRRAARRIVNGSPPEMLGVSQIKLVIAKRLALAPGLPGYCHFPAGRPQSYFDQLTGERLVRTKPKLGRARFAWEVVERSVEALDCRVYAYAALLLSGKLPPATVKAQPQPNRAPAARAPAMTRQSSKRSPRQRRVR